MVNLKWTCENCELVVQFTGYNLLLMSIWSEVKKRGFPKFHLHKASGSCRVNLAVLALVQNRVRSYKTRRTGDICKAWFSATQRACCEERESAFPSGVWCDRSSLCLFQSMGKRRKLQLNPRKNFFPLRVMEPWPRLPRGAGESPSLEIFKPCLDAVLCSLLWVTLLQQEGWTRWPTEVPSNPDHSVILWL